MNTQNSKSDNNTMKVKDIIFTAIFSVLLFICIFAFAIIMGMNPISMFFAHAVGSIPAGIIYMYMRQKTLKKGSIVLMAVLVAVISFALGIGWTAALGILIGGILAELITAAGGYKSKVKNVIGYVAFITCFWAGQMSIMILSTKSYEASALKQGMTQEYVSSMIEFINGPMFFVALAVTIIGAIIGGMLGIKVFKKHFEKLQ